MNEKKIFITILPKETTFLFNQKTNDKLTYIEKLQSKNKSVSTFGNGLNDPEAMAQSNVGITLSENIKVFSPARDAILDATKFNQIANYIYASKKAI